MTWAEHSLRSPGRGKPTRGPRKHSGPRKLSGAQGTGCWHCPHAGRALGYDRGHSQAVISCPRHAGTSPQGLGPPLLTSPPPFHSQGRDNCFSLSFYSHPCLLTYQRPSTLGSWHRPLPILPGVASAHPHVVTQA